MTDVVKSDNLSDFDKAMAVAKTDEDKIKVYYQFGKGTIQDYARIFRFRVEDILSILGLDDMSEVKTQGDLIDQADLRGTNLMLNAEGTPLHGNYSTN